MALNGNVTLFQHRKDETPLHLKISHSKKQTPSHWHNSTQYPFFDWSVCHFLSCNLIGMKMMPKKKKKRYKTTPSTFLGALSPQKKNVDKMIINVTTNLHFRVLKNRNTCLSRRMREGLIFCDNIESSILRAVFSRGQFWLDKVG